MTSTMKIMAKFSARNCFVDPLFVVVVFLSLPDPSSLAAVALSVGLKEVPEITMRMF